MITQSKIFRELIDRRRFLGRMLAGSGAILSGCLGNRQEMPPNIVLIISDDQGWGDYSFMGHASIQTPHLDRLASESLVFTRGYVAAPLCCPSLASIITGLHPHQHKITSNDPAYLGKGDRWNIQKWAPERRRLREDMIANFAETTTIPEILRDLDYQSLQTGKWWMGSYRRGGFTHGMTHGDMDRGGRHGDEGLMIGRKTMQPIFDSIRNTDNRPFFLWYAPMLPHTPHNPPGRLLRKYQEKTDSIHIARYWASCEWFDETCGELLNFLTESGIAKNTMVLYVCDNGWVQRADGNGFTERSKRSPYEGGIRTPIMIRWPGHIAPRFDTSTLVSSIDLAPTILGACGLEPLNDMQGVNLLDKGALRNRNALFGAAFTHDAVDIDTPLSSLKHIYVIEGEWKLILPSSRNGTGTKPELYNVISDPKETRDLSAQHVEIVKRLRSRMKEWWLEAIHQP